MNILSCYFGRHNRGCWKRLKRLLIYYANQGDIIRILTCESDNELNHKNIKHCAISVVNFPKKNIDFLFIFIAPIYFLFTSLFYKPDCIIAFDGHNAFFLNFARFFNRNSKLILLVRGHPFFQNTLNNDSKTIAYLISKIDKIGHKQSSLVIYNSRATATSLIEKYKTQNIPYKIVYNDCNIFFPNPSKSQIIKYKESLRLEEGLVVIGYAGQFTERKNISFLIDAFSKIACGDKGMLLLKGSGPLKIKLLEKVKKLNLKSRVRFLPWDDSLALFYKTVDVFVLPSLYDDCSNSLLEALNQGCCILASRAGGNIEIVKNDPDLLFSLEDHGRDLTQKLDHIIDNYKQSRNKTILSSYSEKFIFNWDEEIRTTIETYLSADNLTGLKPNAK